MVSEREEIIGNHDLQLFLNNLVDQDKLPTALLLAGPAGVGKTTILRDLAQKILCKTGNRCGVCQSCKIGLDNHPDILRLAPSEDEKFIDVVRALLKRIHERPVYAKKLVVFLENIDQYHYASSPLLLKALEGGPAFVVFFITAESIEGVLPTIRSRSLVRYVAPVLAKEMLAALSSRQKNDSQTALNDVDLIKQIVVLAGGRPGLAIRMMADPALREKYLSWYKTLLNLSAMTVGERSQFAETLEKAEDGREAVSFYQSLLRNQLYQLAQENSLPTAKLKKVFGAVRRCREALAMFKANVPQRLVLEYIFFTQ